MRNTDWIMGLLLIATFVLVLLMSLGVLPT
jgi:hypothetical protein